ncbi:MAG: hypothetical protein V2I33_22435, partial [Kangiellaceae bacterium]|nr:hypothetical protein [Kangiellaceae bacterium]
TLIEEVFGNYSVRTLRFAECKPLLVDDNKFLVQCRNLNNVIDFYDVETHDKVLSVAMPNIEGSTKY